MFTLRNCVQIGINYFSIQEYGVKCKDSYLPIRPNKTNKNNYKTNYFRMNSIQLTWSIVFLFWTYFAPQCDCGQNPSHPDKFTWTCQVPSTFSCHSLNGLTCLLTELNNCFLLKSYRSGTVHINFSLLFLTSWDNSTTQCQLNNNKHTCVNTHIPCNCMTNRRSSHWLLASNS